MSEYPSRTDGNSEGGDPVSPLLPSIKVIGALVAVALAGGAASGCSEAIECAPGTRSEDGVCVPICEPGTEIDPHTGACVPVCLPGTHRDSSTGACVPDSARCVSGEVWDASREECLPASEMCARGTTWVASESRCVPLEDLREPDQWEGDGPNDWRSGERSCESFDLPDIGETYSLGGTIGAPADGGPDLDCWNFETDGPTVLRIHADGYGGAAAAFKVVRDDGSSRYVERLGIGTTGSSVTRDIFLPRATRHALITTDAMHLLPGGIIMRGSEDFGYFVEIERLPLPEPETVTGTDVIARGLWTRELPEDRTHLGFYSMPVEAFDMFHLGLHTKDLTVLQTLAGMSPDGSPIEAAWQNQPFARVFNQSGEVLLVADYEYWLAGQQDVTYTLTSEPQELHTLEPGDSFLQIEQPAWRAPGAMPAAYYAFEAEEGDVVTLDLRTSTGQTCFGIWNPGFNAVADQVGCMIVPVDQYDFEVRFVPRRSGLWILAITDWSGGTYEGGTLTAVPQRSFQVHAGLRHQTPLDLGDLTTPFSGEETVTEERYERFFRVTPSEAEEAFRFGVVNTQDMLPEAAVYSLSGSTITLRATQNPDPSAFAARAPEGEPFLVGVYDRDRGPGSFELEAATLEPVDLDLPSDGSTVSRTVTLPAGLGEWFRVDMERAGDLELTITPPSGTNVAYLPNFPNLVPALDFMKSTAGPGDAEHLRQGLLQGEFHFQITDPFGAPLDQETTIEVEARFAELDFEVEPNDGPEEAMPLELPARVAGREDFRNDKDWYRFDLDAPAHIDIRTRSLGMAPMASCGFHVFTSGGERLSISTENYEGAYSQIQGLELDAGTWFLAVAPHGFFQGVGYVLEVTESEE